MTGPGIAISLHQFAIDEGKASAIDVAERWNVMLDDMMELANAEQLQAIRVLRNALLVTLLP